MKDFVIIGLGRFGSWVATTLYQMGHNVLVMDKNPERVQEFAEIVTHAVVADATDESALKALGVQNFEVAIVAIGNDLEASILTTALCKELVSSDVK